MVTDTGFILSKEVFDSSSGVSFVFWLWCEHGPLKVQVEHQEVVFFIPENQVSAATRLLKSQNIHVRFADAKLRNFQNQSVICCYFKSLKDYYRAIQILKSSQILLFEDDVRPIDRFLMERFIKGSVWVKGEVQTRRGYRLLTNAKLKPNNEFRPYFKHISIDIECNGEGVLFSIGLVGDGIDKVLMIGRPEPTPDLDYQINWCEDEIDLLSQFETEIQRIDPDVLIGWNVIEFDFRVLHARAEALGLSLKLGRNKEKLRVREGNITRITIPGRVVVDGIDTLKNATYHYDSFSLANVASIELGEEKLISTDNRL
ncbi:3'-5' exonuclease, partial [uncultured Pseudoalteromonas sp.]|uniref:3'-5' exonuclease n=1 Tax=uncultured Pseudoalteromonas sp. TaxID=114053 RepID=UPI002590A00A